MKEDTVITLKNGKNYLLLLESDLELEGYFLAVLLDEQSNPTNSYTVFQEVKKDGRTFTKKVEDPLILNRLLEDFKLQYEEMTEDAE